MEGCIKVAFEAMPLKSSSSWSLKFALISFVPLLLSITLISVYWSLKSSRPSSINKSYNYIIFFVVNINAIYIVFVEKKATVDWHFEYQLTGLMFSIKIYPNIDFLVSKSLAQLKLEYLLIIRSFLSSSLYMISISFMAFRY